MRSRQSIGVLSCVMLAFAGTAHGATLYATGSDPNVLYSINTVAGVITPVGAHTLVSADDEVAIGGLEFSPSGVLYGVSIGSLGRLYTLSLANGQATNVGLTNQFSYEGGLTFDPTTGTAYMVNGNTSANPGLSIVNLATGQATKIGIIAGGAHDFDGLAFSPTGQLYGLDRLTNALWAIDKNDPSGAGTVQIGGGLGGGINMGAVGGMTYDASNGVYWGYGSGSRSLFTVDVNTGLGSVVKTFDGPNDPVLWSLASPNVIPEPASLGLLAAGAMLCIRRRRR